MNTCPVFRRSGGHSYQTTVPGPIGSILAPARDVQQFHSLPYACSLYGSCTDVCPVKIDLHHQLLTWRREIAVRGLVRWSKRFALGLTSFVMQRPKLFNWAGAVARRIVPWLPRFVLYNPLNPWGRQRELPDMPSQSFREMYRTSRRPKHPAER